MRIRSRTSWFLLFVMAARASSGAPVTGPSRARAPVTTGARRPVLKSAQAVPSPLAAAIHNLSPWEQIPGCAKRIGIFEPEHPFVTGCGTSDDTAIFRLTSARVFEVQPGTGVSVIPVQSGYSFVRSDHTIGGSGGGYACLQEYGHGGEWSWGLSCIAVPNQRDFPVYRHDDKWLHTSGTSSGFLDPTYQLYTGAGVRLGVGLTDSVAWLIDAAHEIFRQDYCKGPLPDEEVSNRTGCGVKTAWHRMPGAATAIANGGKNQVWAIGTDTDRAGNGNVYQWNGTDWTRRFGAGKDIAVDPLGRPWIVMTDGTIWRWKPDVPAKSAPS